ncbi:Retinoblastoma-binding protein 5 [Borealophlyctis nickersoniae]|nr:Retinoblastoma-binding protein 5 [Borealophlyctis nickersoniae]
MNLELLDPFGQDFPEVIEDRLVHDDNITSCRFNRRGNLLASGTSEGLCYIWDMDTRGVARTLRGHAQAITSVSWTKHGRHVLTSSRDWNCIYWDLKDGSKEKTVRFGSPIISAHMHPQNGNFFVALPHGDHPVLVVLPETPAAPVERHILRASDDSDPSPGSNPIDAQSTTVCFDPRGQKIYIGTAKGSILIFDAFTRKLNNAVRVAGASAIKNIQFSRKGGNVVVNAADRVIRVLSVKDEDGTIELVAEHKFQDSVDRNPWAQCCFSVDGEYVIGAAKHTHNIYIWDKGSGNLVKMLEGPREGLVDLAWHPQRPIIASVSHYGTIYIWSVNYVQNYSAFAPSFAELEDNVEYEEREDEFDVEEEERKPEKPPEDDSFEIDVVAVDRINAFSDSDDDDVYYLPTYPEDTAEES